MNVHTAIWDGANARKRLLCIRVASMLLMWIFGHSQANAADAAPDGEVLFQEHCMRCHSGVLGSRAPSRQVLAKFPPRSIVHALTTGAMRAQGYSLGGEQRRAIAEFLTGERFSEDLVAESHGRCETNPAMLDPAAAPMWNGWGNSITNSSFQSAKAAALSEAGVAQLKLKWAFGFPDSFSAWSQPVVASQRVFVGSQAGIFYSLSALTGCTYWQFNADGGIRGAATIVKLADHGASKYAVLFADMAANAYALDANTGSLLWKSKIDSHPKARVTGSPVAYDGRYFVPMSSWTTVEDPADDCCTFRGSLSALDIATGKVLWQTFTIPDEPRLMSSTTRGGKAMWGPSGSAVWAPPLIDAKRRLVYVGTGNSYTGPAVNSDSILAIDIDTGSLRWSRQLTPKDVWIEGCPADANSSCSEESGPDFDIGSPPMLVSAKVHGHKKDLIIVGQKSGVAYALDPDRPGTVVWEYRAGVGGMAGGIVWGSAADGSTAYFPVSDITAPNPGGLHAVDVATGRRKWVAVPQAPLCGSLRYGCNTAQPVGIGLIAGVVFAGSIDGGFRAYSSADGHLLWQYDTNRSFDTINEVIANGGSLIGSGPTIAGGMVFVNSGYGTNGGRAGNVLLAFSVQ